MHVVTPRRAAAALLLVLAALFACKSKGKVTGSVVLDSVPFNVKDCQISEATLSSGGSSTTTHTVTLVDLAQRRLSFSDQGGMKVHLSGKGGRASKISARAAASSA